MDLGFVLFDICIEKNLSRALEDFCISYLFHSLPHTLAIEKSQPSSQLFISIDKRSEENSSQ